MAQEAFFANFAQFMQNQLPTLIQQNQTTQEALARILDGNNQLQASSRLLGNLEQIMESLSNAMTEFTYDVETNSTFENWFNRYQDLFSKDAKNLDDSAKIRLLLRKLDTTAHTRYINLILPKTPSDFSFEDTIKKLKEIFGRNESLFNTRYKCFQLEKNEQADIFTYGGTINKACEDFKLPEMSIEQFKCLIFVMGLKSQCDFDIRTKLLSKLDSEHTKITLDKLIVEYERIGNIKRDSNLIQSKSSDTSILVNKVSEKGNATFKRKPKKCNACGTKHLWNECPSKLTICGHCSKKGHKTELCKNKKEKDTKQKDDKQSSGSSNSNFNQRASHKSFSRPSINTKVSNVSVFNINLKSQRKFIDVQVNSKPMKLQVDSGADISIVSKRLCEKLQLPYSPTTLSPTGASGDPLQLVGEFDCNIKFLNEIRSTKLYVSENDELNIFGNDLLSYFELWNKPFNTFCSKQQVFHVSTQEDYINVLKTNYPSCFLKTLGLCTKFKAHLTLKSDSKPGFCKYRPPPFAIQPLIEQELVRLQNIGVISPTTKSDIAAPIVVKLKKTGDIRICGDFSTGLNDALENHRYPLPLPEDIFAKLNGATIFSHIDLSDAFLQIEMDDESKDLLIINTHIGLFRYNRLSFGIKTAPTIFQQVMDQLIAPLKGVICYMDDIFIFGKTKKYHDEGLFSLMNRIKEFGFHIKLEKSKFALTEITYLGSVVNKFGIKPDQKRVEAIFKMSEPENLTELRSFLGTINFYGKFIKNMHIFKAPLDELLKKDSQWQWSSSCQWAFNKLKKSLSSDLLLTHYNPKLKIIVSADASNKGLGACIQHQMTDGSIKPIAYASRSLHQAEQKYSQIEKEGLGIIFAVKKFHKYIFGREFTLQTDHKPLLAIFGCKKGIPIYTANRLQRWAVILLCYMFQIEYVNTQSFAYVDTLSRLINQQNIIDDEFVVASIKLEDHIYQIIDKNLQSIPVKFNHLQSTYSHDPSMQRLIELISSNWKDYSFHSEPEFTQFFNRREFISVSNDLVLFGDRIVIPAILRDKIIRQLHRGHPGIVKMKILARNYVYWPNIDREIEDFVKACSKCAIAGKSPIKTLLRSWPKPSKAWERVHIDFAGPIKSSYFLVMVDAYSKWPEIVRTSSITSTQTIKILSSIFSRFGTPEQIVSDNGTQFTSEQFQSFCYSNGIEHLRTSPYTPMSNGQAERFVDTFKRSIKKMEGENNIDENLQVFLFNYRSSSNVNCPSNLSPAELLLGRKIRTVFDLLKPSDKHSTIKNCLMEAQYNKKHGAKDRAFKIGDKVFVQIHKNNSWRWEEGIIIGKVGQVNYTVEIANRSIQAHANQLKLRYAESTKTNDSLSFNTLLELFENDTHQSENESDLVTILESSMSSLKI